MEDGGTKKTVFLEARDLSIQTASGAYVIIIGGRGNAELLICSHLRCQNLETQCDGAIQRTFVSCFRIWLSWLAMATTQEAGFLNSVSLKFLA